ncbi:hypothetical protein [Mesorhizobium sp. INR15]|uniref:hypothetical protein n=1 Tax=Mesorhizobium sp. INR15 TaxID=2654248 RepID=UPI00189646BD|nr:hypothetical protein [Mesorhizobium sp. INR15]
MPINLQIWGVAGLATLGVIARPFGLPEFIWAVLGALVMPPALILALGTLFLEPR